MSDSARYHAREWAVNKTPEQIRARVLELEAMPRWKGVEFDDIRVNHMTRTEIDTLLDILGTPRIIPSFNAK